MSMFTERTRTYMMAELDGSLACFQVILEKYQNDHDSSCTYIDPKTAKEYPLKPQTTMEWCRAMVRRKSCVETLSGLSHFSV
jgi:hypothetical protein